MGEIKSSLKVPDGYVPPLTDVRLLKSDGNNPNRMTVKQHEELWHSLLEHGWLSPIVADRDLVFVDGEFFLLRCCGLIFLMFGGGWLGRGLTSSRASTAKIWVLKNICGLA